MLNQFNWRVNLHIEDEQEWWGGNVLMSRFLFDKYSGFFPLNYYYMACVLIYIHTWIWANSLDLHWEFSGEDQMNKKLLDIVVIKGLKFYRSACLYLFLGLSSKCEFS
jgi:hypothetical protein